jgi:hypothetical protein
MLGTVIIDVIVREYSGAVVGRLEAENDVNQLYAAAAAEPRRYPLLAASTRTTTPASTPASALH